MAGSIHWPEATLSMDSMMCSNSVSSLGDFSSRACWPETDEAIEEDVDDDEDEW